VREIACAAPPCPEVAGLKSPPASIAAVLLPQLIHQMLEIGRQFGIFRAKVLLQPFADTTAYRSAGGAIDPFAALIDSVGHRGFHFALCRSLTWDQVTRAEIVSFANGLRALLVKIE
jgi:hypothetical protein